MDLKINMSVEGIATSSLDENEVISNDVITKISFAAGGEKGECVNPTDIFFMYSGCNLRSTDPSLDHRYDFVTYVAKDKRENRYCHVFDCGILSDDVLSTIGECSDILCTNTQVTEFVIIAAGQIFNILTKDENTIQTLKKQKEEIATAPPGGAPQLDNPLYHAMANDQGG